MCLQAIRCNIHEFCCNGLQGVTWSYMALHDHLGYDHVQAYSVVTYNVFWYKTYTFLRSSANSVICQSPTRVD
jgi:hypothetical protein